MTKQDLQKNIASQPSPLTHLPEGEGGSTDFSLSENSTCAFPHADRWKETTLGEVVKFVNDKIEIEKVNLDNYISTENLLPDKLGIQKATTLPNISKVNCFKKEDTLFSNIRTYFKKVWFANINGGSSNDVLIFRPINDRVLEKKFLYYLISSDMFINFIVISAKGTKMPRGDKDAMRTFKINLPPLPQQKAIAGMLGVFDDKIELLREQNKTLEKIGETVFKEYFSLKNPHPNPLPKGEGALPDGWRVGKLGEEFEIQIGRTPPRKESEWFSKKPTGKKWISIKDIGNAGTYIFNTSEYLTYKAIEKFNIPIIAENTTILSFKMTVGKLTITTEEMLSNEAIAQMKYLSGNLSSEFIYSYLKSLDFNSLGSTSSIVTAINSRIIKDLEIIIPPKEILEKFNQAVKPLFEKIKNNSEQIQTLSQTRDTLLPKLMKGEIILSEK